MGVPDRGAAHRVVGDRWEEVRFEYDAADRTMWIDRSDYMPDGFLNVCFEDNYCLLKFDGRRAWLGNADDVDGDGRIAAALLWRRCLPGKVEARPVK